jgi:hypothetical protein
VYDPWYFVKGRLTAATDGKRVFVSDLDDGVAYFPDAGTAKSGYTPVHSYRVRDARWLLATPRTVWSLTPGVDAPQRLDRRTGKLSDAQPLPRGRLHLTDEWGDWVAAGDRVWLLDGAHGALYELVDPGPAKDATNARTR